MDHLTDGPVHEMPEPDAWELLTRKEFGRLAFVLGGDVHIVPVNYALSGRRMLIRTAPGSKLLGIVVHPKVAFETDEVSERTATSVVAWGVAKHLSQREMDATEALQPISWVDTPKYEVIAIELTAVQGRRFDLARPQAPSTDRSDTVWQ